ncbi:chaperone protein dnaJ 20, chloroplastic [Physcomitrium patens]|uniref:J domain-containing protein n=1 Tax=Physcomitrium patens TaxID=3218 RepID=A0A2K1JQA2_PHYPA|nr:chaperone protein dnaJ 20, chloroplastic-like [Physcomitrium patens]PNR43596.1 hypothetical protein PHYPA_015977 [Physcomitrium patens]|eukprot:XP_024391451.1 chaperone protein dnaJ 20, chloroplastic-like [Physcomitrella patens]
MDALCSSPLQVLSSSSSLGSSTPRTFAQGGQDFVSFSSSRSGAFGSSVRSSPIWTPNRREGHGTCECVAAPAAEEALARGSSSTLYSVLGVDNGGSLSDIKSAYKQMALRYHPDVCPIDDRDACTRKFLEVRHAYEVLSDPEKRAEYDFALMHPSFAQALGNSSTSGWGRSRRTQGSEGVSDAWRFQWEAQLSRLRRDGDGVTSRSNLNSWGARMRRENGEF